MTADPPAARTAFRCEAKTNSPADAVSSAAPRERSEASARQHAANRREAAWTRVATRTIARTVSSVVLAATWLDILPAFSTPSSSKRARPAARFRSPASMRQRCSSAHGILPQCAGLLSRRDHPQGLEQLPTAGRFRVTTSKRCSRGRTLAPDPAAKDSRMGWPLHHRPSAAIVHYLLRHG